MGVLLTTGFVSAEEIQGSSVADSGLVVASDPAVAQPLVTETVIKSPIRYVDEPAQEVGYSAVQTQGVDGKLIYTTTADGKTTVQRIEPTETVIVLGTKETTVVTETIKAETVYSLDTSKAYGDNLVINPVDGSTVTKTTYHIETKSTAPVSDAVTSEDYKWSDSNFYHIDQTKALPSDRLVINDLFVAMPKATADYELSESTIRELNQFSEYLLQETVTTTNLDGTTTRQSVIRKVTSEMMDPANTELRRILGLSDDAAFYSRLLQSSKEDLWTTSAEDSANTIVPIDLIAEADDYLRYNNSNVITDAMYADIKADYLRAKEAEKQLTALGVMTSEQVNDMKMIESQFQSLTQRYNNYKDTVATDFDYSHTSMPQEQKADFEARLQTLPEEIRRVLTTVIIYDGVIPGYGETTLGLASSADRSIELKYTADTTELLATVLHELTHIIDYKSGIYTEAVDNNTDNELTSVMGFSDTKEFLDVYHTYFDQPNVWSYYRDNSEEAFAEGFSQYLMHRFFNKPYTMYQASSNGDAYSVQSGGYSPFAQSEYYFAGLYNRLFEYPRTATVLPYSTLTETKLPVNGQVIYGAKPEETTKTTVYKTIYVGDETMAYDPSGQTDRIQSGTNGQETSRRTYSLDSNNQLVATDTIILSIPVENQIITKGTKPQVTDKVLVRTVVYQEVSDDSIAQWEVKVIDQGLDGLEQSVTSYQVDSVTGEITSQTTKTILAEMRPMIVHYRIGSDRVTHIAKGVNYIEDASLDKGKQVTVFEGQDGRSTEALVSYHFVEAGADSHFEAILYSEPLVIAAQNTVIAVGTKELPLVVEPEKVETPQAIEEAGETVVTETKNQVAPKVRLAAVAEMATPTVKNQELPVAGEKDSLLLTLVTSSLLFGMAASFFKKEKN